ncbi:hypothetical protein [Humisphaera borealis]|uniref:Uncharacterized protein n=1 Tax=Humisphaera borealis TaxID=2807512 RepID=A0A7M2WR67_9BACT|nr:hypothetical protein [Humisphaera borealis]QOV87291.1 hypothetical protein IPV69_13415 [Humisphaera borealis]
MSIRAIVKDGQIQPVEPIPFDWVEGQELTIEAGERILTAQELDEWEAEMDRLVSKLPVQDHLQLKALMEEVEVDSKRSTRREWGLE